MSRIQFVLKNVLKIHLEADSLLPKGKVNGIERPSQSDKTGRENVGLSERFIFGSDPRVSEPARG
jgi:hypothetical protein